MRESIRLDRAELASGQQTAEERNKTEQHLEIMQTELAALLKQAWALEEEQGG